MKRVLTLALLVTLLTGSALAADWRLGVQGGVNMSGLNGDRPSNVSFGKRTGAIVGAVGELRIAEDVWLSVQPMFMQRGTTSQIAVPGEPEKQDGPTAEFDYLGVPLLVKIVANNGRTYVTGGINLGFLLDAKLVAQDATEDMKDQLNAFDVAADIGFGLMVPIGRPILAFELRYEQSVLNLADAGREEGDDFLPVRFRSSGFQLLAGIQWPLGGGDRHETR